MAGITPRVYALLEIALLPIIGIVELVFCKWFDY